MKKAVYFISILIVCILTLSLSACNLDFGEVFGTILTNYEFSEDGLQEIDTIFAGLHSGDFAGSIEWRASIVEDGCESKMDVKLVAQKIEETKKIAKVVKKDEVTYRSLKIGSERYVINENERSFYTSVGPEDISIFMPAEKVIQYGSLPIRDNDDNLLWNFVEKRDAKIKDEQDNAIDTKEFEYSGIANEGDKLIVNFGLKVVAGSEMMPPVLKLYYEINEEDSVYKITIYFLQQPSDQLDLEALKIPSESLGYSDLD